MKQTWMMTLIGCFLVQGLIACAQVTPAAPAKLADAGAQPGDASAKAADTSAAPATQPAADARPSPLNAPGFEYPKVDSKAQATFRINAPKAQSVVVGLGKRFALAK